MESNHSTSTADEIIFFVAKWIYHPEIAALIPLPYAIPALMLDTFIGYTLICYFKTPFYRLYLFSNIAQCAHWLTSFCLYRASHTHLFYPLYALIPPSGWIPTLLNFLGYYSVYLNFFFDWLLTVNRCTVFAFPFHYKTLWKKIIPYVLLVGFSYPFIFTWHLIKTGATCTFIPTVGYTIDASEQLTGVSNSLYLVIFIAFYGVSVVAMNLYICFKIFQHRKRNESGSVAINQQSIETELNLFIFTCLNFLLVVLNRFLFQLYIFFNINWMNDEQVITLLGLMMYPEDLSLCLTPLFLLLLCNGLREEIIRRFAKRSPDADNSLFRTVAGQKCSIDNPWNGLTYYSFVEMRPYLGPTVRIECTNIYVAGSITYNAEHVDEMESIAYLWHGGNIYIRNANKGYAIRTGAEDFQLVLNSPTILQCQTLTIDDARFSFKDYKILYGVKVLRSFHFAQDEIDLWYHYWQQFLEEPGVKPIVDFNILNRKVINKLLDRLSKAFSSAVSPNSFKIVIVQYGEPLTEFRETNSTSGEILELKKGLPAEYEKVFVHISYTLERSSI